MRGKKVNQEMLFEVFNKHPDATMGQLMRITGLGSSTLYKYKAEMKKASFTSNEKPRLTVPSRYKESDLQIAVISGFGLGVVLTITAAAFIGVI